MEPSSRPVRDLISSISENVKTHGDNAFVLHTAKSALEGILKQTSGPLNNAEVLAINDVLGFITNAMRKLPKQRKGGGKQGVMAALEEEMGAGEEEQHQTEGDEEETDEPPARHHTVSASFTTPLPLEKKQQQRRKSGAGEPSTASAPAPSYSPAQYPATEPKTLATASPSPGLRRSPSPSPSPSPSSSYLRDLGESAAISLGMTSAPYSSPLIVYNAQTADAIKDARENAVLRGDVSVLRRRVITLEQRLEEQTSRREIAEGEILRLKAESVAAVAEAREWKSKLAAMEQRVKGYDDRMARLRESMQKSHSDSSSAIEAVRTQAQVMEESLKREAAERVEAARREERTKVEGVVEHLQRNLEVATKESAAKVREAEAREKESRAALDKASHELEQRRIKEHALQQSLKDRDNELVFVKNEAVNLKTKLTTVTQSLHHAEEELGAHKAALTKAKEQLKATSAELEARDRALKTSQQQWSHSFAGLQRTLERAESHGAAEEALSRERLASIERLQKEKAQLLASLSEAESIAREVRSQHQKDQDEFAKIEAVLRPKLSSALDELAALRASEKQLRDSLDTTRATLSEVTASRDRLQTELGRVKHEGDQEREAHMHVQEQLRRQASSLNTEISQLKARLTAVFAEHDETREALERENDRLRAEMRDLHAAADETRQEAAAKEAAQEVESAHVSARLTSVQRERDALELRVESLEKTLESLTEEKNHKEGESSRLQAHLVEMDTSWSADRQAYQSKLEQREGDVRRLKEELEEAREDAATLAQRIVVLSSALTEEKERRHEELQNLQTASSQAAQILEQRMRQGHDENSELQSRLSLQQGLIEGLQSELDALRLSASEEKALRQLMARKLEEKDASLTTVSRDRDSLQQAAADLSSASTTAVARLQARAKAEEEGLRREITQLKTRLEESQKQATTGTGSLADCHSRIHRLEMELADARKSTKEVAEEREELRRQMTRLGKVKEELHERLERLTQETARLHHRFTAHSAAAMMTSSFGTGSQAGASRSTADMAGNGTAEIAGLSLFQAPRTPPSLARAPAGFSSAASAAAASPTSTFGSGNLRPPPPPNLSAAGLRTALSSTTASAPTHAASTTAASVSRATISAREYLLRNFPNVAAAGISISPSHYARSQAGSSSPGGFARATTIAAPGAGTSRSQTDQLAAHDRLFAGATTR